MVVVAGAAAAASVAGGSGVGLFSYNRKNFLYDRKLRQETEYQIMDFKIRQAELWREDIKDIIGLTSVKMDTYLIVTAVQLGFCVMAFCEGRLAAGTPVRPPHAPAAIDTSEDALNSESHHGVPPEPMSSPCFGGDNAENGSSAEADIEMIRNHLQGTVQADRVLTQRLQSNCKDLQAQLGTEEAAQAHIKTQAARAADDDRRLRDMAAELERQVTDARERLRQAHEDRRHLHSGQWAKQRSKDTSSFLHEQLEEEGRLLEEMQHSNKLLQESCRSLEQELKDFSAARVEVAAAQRPCTRFFVYCSSGLPGILCHASIADVGRII
mmetsp:Transcript_22711/g.49925  ORF Transcript_22711/g.49925 Transcript_22711/m.49925 type:complete len:325 (-) Transcript_22711:117-1091(-)